jgi:asparagine synthase (glutamine-hydrolysing)
MVKENRQFYRKENDRLNFLRGSNGQGFYKRISVILRHRKLSIIGSSTRAQPIFNQDKSVELIFNGEIYNYIELHNEKKDWYDVNFKIVA